MSCLAAGGVMQMHPTTWALAMAAAALLAMGCAPIAPADVPAIAPPHRQVVVLDIDGTLTPHNLLVFEVRPAAPQVLQAYAGKGYRIVYVTTRRPLFQSFLRGWLDRHGFPPGALHVAQTAAERADAAGFKAAVLARYRAAGWTLAYAYGDSATDFEAYARSGMAPAQIFALRRRGAETCVGAHFGSCLDGWDAHLQFVEREVPSAR